METANVGNFFIIGAEGLWNVHDSQGQKLTHLAQTGLRPAERKNKKGWSAPGRREERVVVGNKSDEMALASALQGTSPQREGPRATIPKSGGWHPTLHLSTVVSDGEEKDLGHHEKNF